MSTSSRNFERIGMVDTGPSYHDYERDLNKILCLKWTLVGLSSFLLMGAIALFSVGVWTITDRAFMDRLLWSDLYKAAAGLLIASGVLLAIVAGLGIAGAFQEKRQILSAFLGFVAILFIFILVASIFAFVMRSQVDSKMYRTMVVTVQEYGSDESVKHAWDEVQHRFKCCGVSVSGNRPYLIWQRDNHELFGMGSNQHVPESCCTTPYDITSWNRCLRTPEYPEHTFQDDCYVNARKSIKMQTLALGVIGLIIALACVAAMAVGGILLTLI